MKQIYYLFFLISQFSMAQEKNALTPKEAYSLLLHSPSIKIIDTRSNAYYTTARLKKAISFDLLNENAQIPSNLLKTDSILIYSQTHKLTEDAAFYFQEAGFKNVSYISGGWEAYVRMGLPYVGNSNKPMATYSINEFTKILSKYSPVLIYFYADWCKVCKLQTPIIDQQKDIKVIKINADMNQSLAEKFEIIQLPSLLLFVNAHQVWQHTGYIAENELKKKL